MRALIFACAVLAVATAAPQLPLERVVGGADAKPAQFPYQISMRHNGRHLCGGSIISQEYILTAAHCVSIQQEDGTLAITPASEMSIRAGSLDRFKGGMIIDVAEILVHEEYNSLWNDVALLRLKRPLIYSRQIQPIPLASKETPAGTPVIISGWGLLESQGDEPRFMQWITLSSISQETCRDMIGVNKENMLCLAHPKDNGACSGDSGGPAMYDGEVVGIAGFVVDICGSDNPDGYAKVFYHRDWIIKHAKL